jgi:hypothetical protein
MLINRFKILDESGVSQTSFSPIDTSDMIMQYAYQYDPIFTMELKTKNN